MPDIDVEELTPIDGVTSSLEHLSPHIRGADIRIKVSLRCIARSLNDGDLDEAVDHVYGIFRRAIRDEIRRQVLKTRDKTDESDAR